MSSFLPYIAMWRAIEYLSANKRQELRRRTGSFSPGAVGTRDERPKQHAKFFGQLQHERLFVLQESLIIVRVLEMSEDWETGNIHLSIAPSIPPTN